MKLASDVGRRLPDFLGIGAPRTGTTWLYHNLRQHPRIWMPPVKELRYFNNPSWLPMGTWLLRGQRLAWRGLLRHVRELRAESRDADILWHTRYLLCPRTDAWYRSLFRPGPGQIAGDVTVLYAVQPIEVVARVRALVPDAKVIYFIRNPVERAWSHAALSSHFRPRAELEPTSPAAVGRFVENEAILRHGDYADTLARWERHFPARQIFVGFYDQLLKDPGALFKDVCGFLGIEASDRLVPPTVEVRRNSRPYSAAPPAVRAALARRYHDQLARLHERLANEYTAAWLEGARHALALA